MADSPDWDAREAAARAALSALDFLLGSWEGEGVDHTRPLRGRFEARAILGGTWVETREQLWNADGALDHEDVALYRHEPEAGLLVMHLQAPGWMSEHPVSLDEDAVVWGASPVEPRVVMHPEDDDLVLSVWFPFQPVPAVRMVYRRVAS
jgi:hypothetical protein